MATATTRITADELLKMPDGDRYELVEGQLVERNVSTQSSFIAGTTNFLVRSYCQPRKLGWVLPENTGYQCFADDPDKVRKPDTSFIRLERLSQAQYEAPGYIRVCPDLAVEVVSPGDVSYAIEEKVEEFLRAGTTLVWVIYPKTRHVHVHRAEGQGAILRETDELDGEGVIPGFRCPVADLFATPA
jgi:Uma2 family endonuclease